MSLALVRNALLAMWQAVPDIGRVHPYQRFAKLPSDMAAHYLWTPPGGGVEHLRGWQFSNTGIEEQTLGLGRVLNKHQWTARGYMSLNDAAQSELLLDDLAEDVRAAFRADPSLGGVCSAERRGDGPDLMQKTDAGAVMFCGVLCNSVVLQWQTWRYES